MKQIQKIFLITMGMIMTLAGCNLNEPVFKEASVDAGEFPFVGENKMWFYKNFYGDIYYKMTGDTIIKGYVYKKVYTKIPYKYNNNFWHYVTAVRQHGPKVYAIKSSTTKEFLVYDFSLEEGDWFTWAWNEDSTVDECKIAFKRIRDDGRILYLYSWYSANRTTSPLTYFSWIEGIGATGTLFGYLKLPHGHLVNCFEDEVCIYHDVDE